MRKILQKKLYILVLFLAIALAFSGCGRKNENKNEIGKLRNSEIEGKSNTATSTDEIDTSDWKIYRNEELKYEFKYPANFIISELRGEFYNEEEYPLQGIIISDSKNSGSTFNSVDISIHDRGWIDLGTDFFERKIFYFNKENIKNISDLKTKPEFNNGIIEKINSLEILRINVSNNIYGSVLFTVIQNPENSNFIVFSISLPNDTGYKKINDEKSKVLKIILENIIFLK